MYYCIIFVTLNIRMMVRDAELRVFPKLRTCTSAGEPLNPEVISIWYLSLPSYSLPYPSPTPLLFPPLTSCRKQVTKVTIREFYGQSETTAVVGNTPSTLLKPGSMGLPLPPYDVQVSPLFLLSLLFVILFSLSSFYCIFVFLLFKIFYI